MYPGPMTFGQLIVHFLYSPHSLFQSFKALSTEANPSKNFSWVFRYHVGTVKVPAEIFFKKIRVPTPSENDFSLAFQISLVVTDLTSG